MESSASCTAVRAKWLFSSSRRVSSSTAATSSVTAASSPSASLSNCLFNADVEVPQDI